MRERRGSPMIRLGALTLLLHSAGVFRCRTTPSASAFAARTSALTARRRLLPQPPAARPRSGRDAGSFLPPLLAERGGGGDGEVSKDQTGGKSDNLSTEGIIFMALLALQFGVQPSLVKAFTPRGVVKSSVVLVQEVIKFVIASFLYSTGTSKDQQKIDKAGISLKTWLKIAIVPAALYNVQNIAALLAYQNLEPLTFNVLNQTKTLSAALCCYFVIGKKQSSMQMCSLILLLVAALIIEKIVSLSTFTPPFFSGTTGLLGGLFAADGSMKLARHVTHGVFPILIASFISGLAGAIVQKNLQGTSKSGEKKRAPRNPYLFNMELNSASAILLIVSLLFSGDGRQIAKNGFFHQWTPQTFIPIITNSVGGIIVALVTKYAGAVRKGFALIFGILISGLIQAETGGLATEQVMGGFLAAASLYLHTMFPFKPKSEASSSDKKK